MGWLVPRNELTPDQLRAVELGPDRHRVILGGPGSGKTLVLVYRARFLCEEYSIRPKKFHVFVFTKVLKEYIRSALVELDLPDETVTTLDDWCVQVYRARIDSRLPWNAEERCPDYAAIRRAVRDRLDGQKLFDAVLVDEGQDLEPKAFELIRDLAWHVTVAMDHKQQIYREGSGVEEILRALNLRRGDVTLLEAYRCSPYIVRIAAEFIPDQAERRAFLEQSRTAQSDIQTPLFFEAADWREEEEALHAVLRERQLVDQSVAILFPKRKQAFAFARRCAEQGIELELWDQGLDFNTRLPKVITYHSAKGLTFDSVLLPRLVPGSFPGFLGDWVERLLFVGITRAVRWVYFSTTCDDWLPELERLRRLAGLRPPVITLGSPLAPPPPPPPPAGDDDILNIL